MATTEIKIQKTTNSRLSTVDFDKVVFGHEFSDHMLTADYFDGKWQNFQIIPFQDISINPAFLTLHYGQSIFEGMKAHKAANGDVLLFRPLANFERLNISAERMCIPQMDTAVLLDGLKQLINIDKDWIPSTPDGALYLRPFIFATDQFIGVRPSDTYKFILFTCPVNKYYDKAVKVKVETKYVRAAEGGVGFAKAAGNYAGGLYPTKIANEEGFDQLIWLDAMEHKFIEESGTMNLMVIIDDVIITPPSGSTVLNGITRDSVLKIAQDLGFKTEVRRLSIDEVIQAHNDGKLNDMFGTGTAVTITPISEFGYKGKLFKLPEPSSRTISSRLKTELEGIKRGTIQTTHNWVVKV